MSDDILNTLDAAAFCADHTEWQEAIRSAIDEIVRMRAVLDTIDALHQPCNDGSGIMVCKACDLRAPCRTHLLIHPMTLDEAIWILGNVHK